MIQQHHNRFRAMAYSFIRKYTSLQGDDSMCDLLVNEIYVRVLELSPVKRADSKVVMRAAWLACMASSLWHMSSVMGRKPRKEGDSASKSRSLMPILTEDYNDIRETGYDPEVQQRLEFKSFVGRLSAKSQRILVQHVHGYSDQELARMFGLKKHAVADQLLKIRKLAKLHAVGLTLNDSHTGWNCPVDQEAPLSIQESLNISRIPNKDIPKKEVFRCQ